MPGLYLFIRIKEHRKHLKKIMRGVIKNAIQAKRIVLESTPIVFMNLKMHSELFRVLKYYRDNKLIKFRTYRIYLFSYLSKGFSIKQKLFILTHHYNFLKLSFSNYFLEKIFREGVVCWEEDHGINHFKVLLKSSNYLEFEGSLTLIFTVNNTRIFSLSFNFVPGKFFRENEETILFVSALKGVKNEFSNITLTTKTYSELIPQVILMKIIESIAHSLNVKSIITINATNQVSFNSRHENRGRFYINYDQLWENLGGEKLSQGYYFFVCPYNQKSILLKKSKRRKRTLTKRNKLKEIYNQSISNFTTYINRQG